MPSSPPEFVARERLRIGGVTYFIGVIESPEGDFRADWKCCRCGQVGRSASAMPSQPAALCWARDGLRVHHAIEHLDEAESA